MPKAGQLNYQFIRNMYLNDDKWRSDRREIYQDCRDGGGRTYGMGRDRVRRMRSLIKLYRTGRYSYE